MPLLALSIPGINVFVAGDWECCWRCIQRVVRKWWGLARYRCAGRSKPQKLSWECLRVHKEYLYIHSRFACTWKGPMYLVWPTYLFISGLRLHHFCFALFDWKKEDHALLTNPPTAVKIMSLSLFVLLLKVCSEAVEKVTFASFSQMVSKFCVCSVALHCYEFIDKRN